MRSWRTLVFLAALSACTGGATNLPARGSTCWIDGFETPVRCFSMSAPLDYENPDGPTITISAVIAAAATARPSPDPLFVFAGGPGQAASDLGPWLNTAFAPVRRKRDIVLVDIRGTGRSSELACEFRSAIDTAMFLEDAAACAAKLGDRARHHSAREIVEDVERLRQALGYREINLWGGSYGTRIVQHYVRAHGAHVRAVVMDAATPAGRSLFLDAPRFGEQALARVFDACKSDSICNAAYPRLREDFAALLARAEGGALTGAIPDPLSGEPMRTPVDRALLANIFRGAAYVDVTRSLIPFAVKQGLAGDLRPIAALASTTASWSTDQMTLASTLSVLCPEDVHQARLEDRAALWFGFLRDSYFRFFEQACAAWPYEPLPAQMLAPFRTDKPAMVISGEADPVTPPAYGAAVLAQFRNGVHIVVPRGLHTNSADPCLARIIARYIDDPANGGRDKECLRAPAHPHFLTTPNT